MVFSKKSFAGFLHYLSSSFIAIAFVALLWRKPFLLFLLLLALSALLLLQKKDLSELRLYIFCSLGGAFFEIIAIYFKTWSYALPQFVGVPFWLFPLWGFTAVVIKRLAEVF